MEWTRSCEASVGEDVGSRPNTGYSNCLRRQQLATSVKQHNKHCVGVECRHYFQTKPARQVRLIRAAKVKT